MSTSPKDASEVIGWWWRLLAAAVGIGATGVGSYLAFTTKSQAGITALIGGGILLIILAVIGKPPSQVTGPFGSISWLATAAKQAKDAEDAGDKEQARSVWMGILAAVAKATAAAHPPRGRRFRTAGIDSLLVAGISPGMLDASAYEQALIEALATAFTVDRATVRALDYGDAVVRNDQKRLLLEVRAGTKFWAASVVAGLMGACLTLDAVGDGSGVDGAILAVQSLEQSPEFLSLRQQLPQNTSKPLLLVAWLVSEGSEALVARLQLQINNL